MSDLPSNKWKPGHGGDPWTWTIIGRSDNPVVSVQVRKHSWYPTEYEVFLCVLGREDVRITDMVKAMADTDRNDITEQPKLLMFLVEKMYEQMSNWVWQFNQ